ncbi:hypothetical protein [Edaphobacillus lindanitolerans]|uniref:Uncharacterized protein n=1 Tax=Edaphobacillus lindanitolerans TaxID=550447 RepID=A0A1U7PLN6_9BACI|nr:hypothetical protein [Edaphobacillus lindanitolerans]SIT88173.1 hypothetical protein SAMN05428946_2234 [Edaphobacillus lindanitolerans]
MGKRIDVPAGRAIQAGFSGGLILGALLYAAERLTGLRVYTLLMNVDYVPVLKEYRFPSPVEFLFHLIVSMVLAVVLLWAVRRFRLTGRRMAVCLVSLSGLVGLGIWPVTALSDRTPDIGDMTALVVWLAAHLVYGGVLVWMYWRSPSIRKDGLS